MNSFQLIKLFIILQLISVEVAEEEQNKRKSSSLTFYPHSLLVPSHLICIKANTTGPCQLNRHSACSGSDDVIAELLRRKIRQLSNFFVIFSFSSNFMKKKKKKLTANVEIFRRLSLPPLFRRNGSVTSQIRTVRHGSPPPFFPIFPPKFGANGHFKKWTLLRKLQVARWKCWKFAKSKMSGRFDGLKLMVPCSFIHPWTSTYAKST